MKIIERYYLKEFFRLFTIIGIGLSLIFSLIELVNRVNDFAPYRPQVSVLLLFTILNMPGYLIYLMPMAALLSSLFVIGQSARRRETVAIKTSGGSIKRLLVPIVYSGIFLSITGFLIGEFIAPDFSKKAHKLSDSITGTRSVLAFKEGTAWLRVKDYIVKLYLYLPDKGVINGVSILRIADDMLTERIEAEAAEWKPVLGPETPKKRVLLKGPDSINSGGVWYLRGVTVHDIKTGRVTKHKELQTDIIDPPYILGKGMQKPEEMNVRELLAYTKRLKEAGIKNIKLLVDINARLSYPLINIIMVVIGISLATRGGMEGGLVTAAIGIFISFIYWLGYTALLSLGYTGILPPVLASWLVPFTFGGTAVYLFRKIPE